MFVCGPACFYVARSLEQVKVDVAYSGQPVKILGVSGGVAYGALGATHHSLHDIAVLRTFPGMQVVLPCDARQTRKLVEQLVDYPHPVYVRVGRNAVPDVYENDDFNYEIGKSIQLQDGKDLTIIGTGETVYHALKAGQRLAAEGVSTRVIDMHTLKPADTDAIIRAAKETGRIITVEEHSMYGALAVSWQRPLHRIVRCRCAFSEYLTRTPFTANRSRFSIIINSMPTAFTKRQRSS